MNAGFFQKNWAAVGDSVSTAALHFLNGQACLRGLNRTLICLIPKVESPTKPADFRPISLCNVFYKIITKAMAIRMRESLGLVIAEEQSAFLPRRLITDNALIGFECINYLKKKKVIWVFVQLNLICPKRVTESSGLSCIES